MNTIIEKIRAEVERLKELHKTPTFNEDEYEKGGVNGYQLALDKVLAKLSDLEKEEKPSEPTIQEQPVCEDLESYAQTVEDYYDVGEWRGYLCTHRGDIKNAVLAGAKWQKEQMMKDWKELWSQIVSKYNHLKED